MLADFPRTRREEGAVLLVLGVVILGIGPVYWLFSGVRPGPLPGLVMCGAGAVFLGAGLPFLYLGERAVQRFGHPRRLDTWPTWWWLTLTGAGAALFLMLWWHPT